MPTLTPQQVEDAARAMPDHTLATSFLEPDARARVIALILFAHEIARARSVVSEAGLAAIRLQWWRDTIDQIYTGQTVRAQPTAIALAGAIEEAGLPRSLFDGIIDGHACELEDMPFQTWSDLESYLDATHGNLMRLSLLASGLPAMTSSADGACRHAATAWGLSHLLVVNPSWLERRSSWFPREVGSSLNPEALFAGHVDEAVVSVLTATKARIKVALGQANACLKPAQLGAHFPALAPACLSMAYAKTAAPAVGQAWKLKPELVLLRRQLAMTLAVAKGRI